MANRGSGGRGPHRSPARPKGQVQRGKTVQYAIKGPDGTTKYVGTTNNPRVRAAQRQESGKLAPGDRLQVQTKPIPRPAAERVEAARIGAHRRQNGANPQHNKTNDGKYHK